MIRWWLDKGIDGFRLDAISHVKKMNILLKQLKTPFLLFKMFPGSMNT